METVEGSRRKTDWISHVYKKLASRNPKLEGNKEKMTDKMATGEIQRFWYGRQPFITKTNIAFLMIVHVQHTAKYSLLHRSARASMCGQ